MDYLTFLRVAIALQLAAIVAFGALTAGGSAVPGPVDEHAHLSYIEYVAVEHRTPLITDPMSPQVAAIARGSWPRVVPGDPRTGGLAGMSYEAFQPPLYYVLAAPIFLTPSDYMTKVYAVRSFNLLVLLLGAAFLWRFARSVFGDRERSMFAYSVALNALLLPGVVRRAVQISNAALEIVAAILVLWLLWEAHTRQSDARLLVAAAALGLALLTKLTLVWLVPLFGAVLVLRVWRHPSGGAIATAVACVALPLVLVAPWLISNEHRYGTLTAHAQAQAQQESTVNPLALDYGAEDLPDRNLRIIDVITPQEWTPPFGTEPNGALASACRLAGWLMAVAAILLLPSWLGWTGRLLLAAPLVVALVVLNITLLRDNWDVLLPRYLYPTLPALGLAVGASADRLLQGKCSRAAFVAVAPVTLTAAWGWFLAAHG